MSSLYLKGKHIYLRAKINGRWKGMPIGLTLEVVHKKNGKVIFPKEAIQLKREIDLQLSLNKFGLAPKVDTTRKLSVLQKEYVEYKRNVITKTTEEQYKYAIDKLIDELGDIEASQVTEKDIAKCRGKWLDTLSEHTVAKTLRQLSAIFEFACKNNNRYCEFNPVSGLKLYPSKNPPDIFSSQELLTYFTKCKENNIALFNQSMFLLLTGFRLEESCELTWDRVDFENSMIRHNNQKGNRKEHYPMDEWLQSFMQELPRIDPIRVFFYKNRRRMGEAFNEIKKACNLRPALTLHKLKGSYATTLYETSDNLLTIQQLAHHSDIKVTKDHYIKFRTTKTRDALEKSREALPDELRKLSRKAS